MQVEVMHSKDYAYRVQVLWKSCFCVVQSTGKLPTRLLGKSDASRGCKANFEKQSVPFLFLSIACVPLLVLRKTRRNIHFFSDIALLFLLVLWVPRSILYISLSL